MDKENDKKYRRDFPYTTYFITMTLVVLYTWFLFAIYGNKLSTITVSTLVITGIYILVNHIIRLQYLNGKVSKNVVYFSTLGGMLLLFLSDFVLCTSKI